jgi:hypothetical protein
MISNAERMMRWDGSGKLERREAARRRRRGRGRQEKGGRLDEGFEGKWSAIPERQPRQLRKRNAVLRMFTS